MLLRRCAHCGAESANQRFCSQGCYAAGEAKSRQLRTERLRAARKAQQDRQRMIARFNRMFTQQARQDRVR
jgi:predicted secreted protein